MAHQFPQIVAYGSAFRFALEAEEACADLAAAADALAPSAAFHERLEELLCTHRDRVAKLTLQRQQVNEMILEPIHSLDGAAYLGTLDAEPAASWPAVLEQLIAAEEDTARYHEDFVAAADDVLAVSARVFSKAARQDRAAAAALREHAGRLRPPRAAQPSEGGALAGSERPALLALRLRSGGPCGGGRRSQGWQPQARVSGWGLPQPRCRRLAPHRGRLCGTISRG